MTNVSFTVDFPDEEPILDSIVGYYKSTQTVRSQVASINKALKPSGLRMESWLILLALEDGQLSQSSLIEMTGIHKVATSRALSELAAAEYISHEFLDADRRTKIVRLTDAGMAALLSTRERVVLEVDQYIQ